MINLVVFAYRDVTVLIDTWWNVNYKHMLDKTFGNFCFNRYMVECEFFSCGFNNSANTGFNRYMVECESRRSASALLR